jgi:hypothetical protein
MPKLDATKTAFLVEKFGEALPTLPPGTYTGTLVSVIAGKNQYGGPGHWIWTLDVEGRRLPLYTETSDKPISLLRLKQAFAAFGADPETDTDELIGTKVVGRQKSITITAIRSSCARVQLVTAVG